MKLFFLFTAATFLGVGVRCRFTVRDIGFVNLSGPLYTLRHAGTHEQRLGPELTALLEGWALDGNVAVGTREDQDAGGGWWLEREGLAPLLLREDAERSGDRRPDAAEARSVLQSALHSPLRDEVLARCLGSFAIMLLVEGTDSAANEAAREELADVRGALRGVQDQLPRPIRRPLEELILPRAKGEAERVLLWSLGLGSDETRPAVCVLYGRGKLAGRVMVGKQITGQELLAQLYLVGESCECDTPRDWVNEPTIPMAWTERQRVRAASELGFDPESPMVRAEVVRILERGFFSGGAGGLPGAQVAGGVEALLLGYRETVLGGEEGSALLRAVEQDGGQPSTLPAVLVYEASEGDDWNFESEPRKEVTDAAPRSGATDPPSEVDSSSEPYRTVFAGLIGLLVLSFLAVLLVLLPRKSI